MQKKDHCEQKLMMSVNEAKQRLSETLEQKAGHKATAFWTRTGGVAWPHLGRDYEPRDQAQREGCAEGQAQWKELDTGARSSRSVPSPRTLRRERHEWPRGGTDLRFLQEFKGGPLRSSHFGSALGSRARARLSRKPGHP